MTSGSIRTNSAGLSQALRSSLLLQDRRATEADLAGVQARVSFFTSAACMTHSRQTISTRGAPVVNKPYSGGELAAALAKRGRGSVPQSALGASSERRRWDAQPDIAPSACWLTSPPAISVNLESAFFSSASVSASN